MPLATKEAQRAYQRVWKAKRRADWISANGPCKECGSTEKLELHHKDPKQKVTHNVWSLREERRRAELMKCTVLCKRCHRKHTAAARRARYRMVHGTTTAYRKGCRCEICRLYFAGRRKSWPSRQPIHLKRKKEKRNGNGNGNGNGTQTVS